MPFTTDIHPEDVLAALLAKGPRAQVQRTLNRIHEICRKQHETGSRDFSLATIGRLCEQQGIFKGRILYNVTSRDYKDLILAWGAYVGPPVAPPPKALASHGYLMRIEDPAIRSIMQAIIAERDNLKAQVNHLKATRVETVDMRPIGATVVPTPKGTPIAILEMAAQLTEPERDALKAAISPEFLGNEGWTEGERGEIRKGKRVIYQFGYATAIRKILGK
ncbi:gamma-mobile-trio protein GmtX [Mesoterricola silvestris]|uniref:Uncharacterized protein n=1 Tax=Mesoterricola silvestris TaxID=2927979 RepID=A0AA48K7R3_9BACT|nr:gamma-mobile-trio protein GmtX [Mesoterricola silvestris]BDU71421.1 hypothetical protein METEAL_05950 [Mesoterricola silvestris]